MALLKTLTDFSAPAIKDYGLDSKEFQYVVSTNHCTRQILTLLEKKLLKKRISCFAGQLANKIIRYDGGRLILWKISGLRRQYPNVKVFENQQWKTKTQNVRKIKTSVKASLI